MQLCLLCVLAVLCLPVWAQPEPSAMVPANSIVMVAARSECAASSQGSGVVVAPGVVVTSAHVVQGATEVKILKDGKFYFASAHILAPEVDLCLLRIPGLPCPPAPIASEPIVQGMPVLAIGFPGGQGPRTISGSVKELWRFRGSRLIQSDAATHRGSSGGGLFTSNGHLLGVTTFTILSFEGLNFSLPAAWIAELLQRPWTQGGTILLCKSKEALLQDFLDGMTEDPTNRAAWEAFSRAWVNACPKDPEAWYSLGHTLFQRISGEEASRETDSSLFEAARQAYSKALERNPGHARAWNNLGTIQDLLGQSEEAIGSFRMALRLKNDYGLAWLNLGGACLNNRNFEEAVRAFRHGLALLPDEASAWVRLALCEEKAGARESAIHHLLIALRLYPTRIEWWLDLAQMCRRGKCPETFEAALAFLRDRLPSVAKGIASRTTAIRL